MKLILSVSFIIISVALFFVFTDPTIYGDIRALNTDVSAYNEALNNSTELQRTRDTLSNTYKNIPQEDKDNLSHFLPDTIGNIELILEIEKIANLYGMPVKNIKFDTKSLEQGTVNKDNIVVAEKDPKDYLPYGVFPMEFVIEGRYDTFVSFLKELEHNLRLVDVKSISFVVPSPSLASTSTGTTTLDINNPNIYSFTLQIEIYWLK